MNIHVYSDETYRVDYTQRVVMIKDIEKIVYCLRCAILEVERAEIAGKPSPFFDLNIDVFPVQRPVCCCCRSPL